MANVWNHTLELLRSEEPSFKGFFHMMEQFSADTAAELREKDGTVIKRTYREYLDSSFRVCGFIQENVPGASGDIVGLSYETSLDWPVLLWGILMAGKIPLLLNPAAKPEQIAGILKEAGAKAYVSAAPITPSFDWIDASKALSYDKAGTEIWGGYIAFCTSGTVSSSRIFLYDARTIANHILSFNEAKKVNPDMPFIEGKSCKLLAFLPFHHIFGFSVVYLLYSCTGKTLVYCRDKSVQTILDTCSKQGVTHLYCIPMFFNALADGIRKQLGDKKLNPIVKQVIKKKTLGTSIRSMITGGGHVPDETLDLLNDIGYPLSNGFGMTESGIIAVETSLSAEQRKKGSVGIPFSLTEFKIDPEGSEQGELMIRGDALYAASIINGEIIPRDKSVWFATGDLARKTSDGLFLIGRIKDVIVNASGENIYPDELEDTFSGLSGISRICILGVKHGLYEDVTLVAEPAASGFRADALRAEIRAINDTLSFDEKITRVLVSRSPLPVSGNMKVKRQLLKSSIESGNGEFEEIRLNGKLSVPAATVSLPAVSDPEFDEIKKTLRTIISENSGTDLKEDSIGDYDSFSADLGIDSLNFLSIVTVIEEKYGIVILDNEASSISTLQDATAYVYAKLHGTSLQIGVKDTENAVRITDFSQSREYIEMKKRMEETFVDGMNPYFIPHDSLIRDTSVIGGKEVINLGSYNYLGMSGNPETMQAAIDAVKKYGTSASGSRTLAGEKTLYTDLEKTIAHWKHTEDAVVGTGGWATNLSFVSSFMRKGDFIVYDALSHNSLSEGVKLSEADSKAFEHNNLKQLEDILGRAEGKYNKVLIIVEGVYSMDGDIAPIPDFVRIKKQYGCFLMVDEAHSGGVIGENGGGCDDYFHLQPDDIDIKYGTLSKALGTCGGYIAARKEIIEYLKYNMNVFVFSAGIAPPLAAACKKAIELIETDNSAVQKLHENISYFVKRAKEEGMNTCLAGESGIVPIMIGSDAEAAALSFKLLEKGVFVPPAMYPAVPMGESRLRFTISSTHSIQQLEKAISELSVLMHEAGLLK